MRILGINAVFHDPAAAVVIDGEVIAAAEEERFTRRKHGKQAVPFSTWELPVAAARWCLEQAGLTAADIDAVGYSYDPWLMIEQSAGTPGLDGDWEDLRTLYAQRAPKFLATALPGLDPDTVRFVRHHVAHAASTSLASPYSHSAGLGGVAVAGPCRPARDGGDRHALRAWRGSRTAPPSGCRHRRRAGLRVRSDLLPGAGQRRRHPQRPTTARRSHTGFPENNCRHAV